MTVTILDYLNDDCLHAVLQYVPVKDLILLERVSQRWQKAVLEYLQHVRLGIDHDELYVYPVETLPKVSRLLVKEHDLRSFESWTRKLGPSVVAARYYGYSTTLEFLRIIGENCPNIEALVWFGTGMKLQLLLTMNASFKLLKQLHFGSDDVTDDCVTRIVSQSALEELTFRYSYHITGQFLTHIELKNLRCLIFVNCERLESLHFLSVDLSQLTKLELYDDFVEANIYYNLHLLLDKMPRLEYLHVYNVRYDIGTVSHKRFFEAVCRINRLRDLSVNRATDEQLVAVARRCRELQALELLGCPDVSARGISSVCALAGVRLTALGIRNRDITEDDDIVACVRACPNLELLDIRGNLRLTAALTARLVKARRGARRPLRLRVDGDGADTEILDDETFEENAGMTVTILDYLNDDCLHAVLQYVPVKDLILSERVSRRWQKVVLEYLQRVRLGIDHEKMPRCPVETLPKVSRLLVKERDLRSFESWTRKLGPSVVAARYYGRSATLEILRIMGKNCPNIETLVWYGYGMELRLLRTINASFKLLKQLHFGYGDLTDNCVTYITGRSTLEELIFRYNNVDYFHITGEFLTHIELKDLRSLFFEKCLRLESRHFLSADLSQLTKLELYDDMNVSDIYYNLHLVLDKMPRLEYLHVYHVDDKVNQESFFEAVCRLSRLRDLSVVRATDEQVVAVARHCRELHALELNGCDDVSARGIAGVCALAGARLTALNVRWCTSVMEDDDIVACVRACPNLELLDIRNACKLTAALTARLVEARRGAPSPLLLRADTDDVHVLEDEEHAGLILEHDFS